ncbi:TPA: hypothetical protein DEF17_06325 [bacterium]|nr:MAG: hypothetical protein AUJ18_06325 [Candidatus Hydrogenedentes bacterium CG1_02_42_14]PIU47964.1 MAG: hypothetical protein COS94_04615 [Candidatus Hydrogenedentes bacterium CG07_land_8_20_14_0_80_42_17]HBW47532.1 hypothetical protein [bacterium]
MDELPIENVLAETGISRRNINYWVSTYSLEIVKRGRKNYFPRKTVELLKLISMLSNLNIFSSIFIRWLIDIYLSRKISNENELKQLLKIKKIFSNELEIPVPKIHEEEFNVLLNAVGTSQINLKIDDALL